MSFYFKDGYLYCEQLKVKYIQEQIEESPFYLYSLSKINENYKAYQKALEGLEAKVGYAIKANNNLFILKHLQKLGAGAVLVSGNELLLAMKAGFEPKSTVFNGNGKTIEELRLAVENEVLINIDSEFDLRHISDVASEQKKVTEVLIRINPDIDAEVHPYVSTGIKESKFGIRNDRIEYFLEVIDADKYLELVGIHCHLGSTIKNVKVFQDAAMVMMDFVKVVREQGFEPKYLNLGGGLGIDYYRTGEDSMPTPQDLVDSIREYLDDDISLIMEPGRSIIGDASILVNRVTGVKSSGEKHFIVVDGSMAELIRPSLYDAYHHISFIEPIDGEVETYDVVGPVCESADFFAKERKLPTPHEGTGLVVYDTGAYCYSMSSNYNMKMRPPEYLVDGEDLIKIRRAETLDDFMRLFDVD